MIGQLSQLVAFPLQVLIAQVRSMEPVSSIQNSRSLLEAVDRLDLRLDDGRKRV